MVWKRFEGISSDWRHAGVSIPASWLWCNLLDLSDILGRFPSDKAVVGASLKNRPVLRLSDIEGYLAELARVGLIHLYVPPAPLPPDGVLRSDDTNMAARFGVIHDFEKYLPPGFLRYKSAVNPAPPPDLCGCVLLDNRLRVPPSPSSSLPRERSSSPAPQKWRPPPSPSSGGRGDARGEGVFGSVAQAREARAGISRPLPDCPKCKGSGYYQAPGARVGNIQLPDLSVICSCRLEKTS